MDSLLQVEEEAAERTNERVGVQLQTEGENGQRVVNVPCTDADKKKFPTNEVCTSRYNLLTWAPKSLILQFRRAANVYFLLICILTLQTFSSKRWDSMIGTFAVVLVFTSLKEAWEDYFRHKQDKAVNTRKTEVFSWTTGEFLSTEARYIRVGDIVKVLDKEPFPADLVQIASSDPNGISYIDTMNLDGESNLKNRASIPATQTFPPSALLTLDLRLEYDPPKRTLVRWNCNYMVKGGTTEPLSTQNLLLRGCVLRNTAWVLGVVLYTGVETKISLNSKKPPSKQSNVLRQMNKMLYTVFAFQACICLTFSSLSLSWLSNNASSHSEYLSIEGVKPESFFINALTFLVAYSHLIPISLYVTLEILRLAQAFLISRDLDLYYEPDDRRANCRSSDLIEELGQIQFIFSDKTGTLTQNVMEFQECSINGKILVKKGNGFKAEGDEPGEEEKRHFFMCLAVCHSVFASGENPPKYQAASPDELALVTGAAEMQYRYLGKTGSFVNVECEGGVLSCEILAEIPFTSERKRMSVIVKDLAGDGVWVVCKGADSVIVPRTNPGEETDLLWSQLDAFARKGLRTLVLAERKIGKEEYDRWAKQWKEITLLSSEDKQDRMDAQADLLEHHFTLLGATAIEDKLQSGVPETIHCLLRAHIRIWVLTGDKQETAIEIAKACNLFSQDKQEKLLILSANSAESAISEVSKLHETYITSHKTHPGVSLQSVSDQLTASGVRLSIVIDGITLEWVLSGGEMRRQFYELGYVSKACVCCRVSPAQKMQVVQLVKEMGKWITLAIGDGANDVSMIQEAHIGIGISGKEGTQAVQAADYSLSQFRYLQKLLLVHGRWGYRRISLFICYYFYKNMVIVFAEICFAFFNGYSGLLYWADWIPALYNTFWTSWPCLITFCYEQDLSARNSLQYPETYRAGQLGRYFNFKRFWMWVICAIYHGLLCFWVPCAGMGDLGGEDGQATGLYWLSTLSFTVLIHVVSVKLMLESGYWTVANG